MHALTTQITYQKHTLPGLVRDGQIWIGGDTLSPALGLTDRGAIRTIMRRHKEDFGPAEAQLLTVQTSGGPQQRWMVSRSGAEAVAFHARTPEGRAFRRWCFQDWQAWRAGGVPAPRVEQAGTREPLGTQARRFLDLVQARLEMDHPANKLIEGLRSGAIGLQGDPMLSRALARWETGRNMAAEAQRVFREAEREAAALGYTPEQFKAQAAWQRKTKESPDLPMLPGFGDAEGE